MAYTNTPLYIYGTNMQKPLEVKLQEVIWNPTPNHARHKKTKTGVQSQMRWLTFNLCIKFYLFSDKIASKF